MNQLVVAAALIVAAAAFPFPGPADEEAPAGADSTVRAERQAAFLRGRGVSRLNRDEVSCTLNEF